MACEYELKFRCPDHAAVRAALHAQGGVLARRVQEHNRLYDRADGTLRAADCGLRLRCATPLDGGPPVPALLTYKGPRASGVVKVREELETAVGDAGVLATMLTRLGYRVSVEFAKRRETWRFGECLVMLDELPRLGGFLEIEGPGTAALEAARGRLGLADAAPLRETYLALIAQHVTPGPDGTLRLDF
jgi:adenylate cyclase class 2